MDHQFDLYSVEEEGDEHQDPTYIETDSDEKPFKLPTKKKSGSDELFIEENLNDDDSMPNIIIKDITSKFHEVVPDTYEKIKRSSKYKLPSDDEIMGRIQLRHLLFRYVWQSNFSSPIDEKLRNGAKVLDIGGSWVLDMASNYPNSEFIGIDMAPMFPNSSPSNVEFSVIDINKGLPYEDSTFDFVHLRFLVQYLTENEWQDKVIKELLRVTKKDCWIEIMELDLIFNNAGIQTNKLQDATISYFNSQNINSVISHQLSTFLNSTSAFNVINYEERYTPLGKWGGRLGRFSLVYFYLAYQNMKKVLPQHMKISDIEYDHLVEGFHSECEQNKIHIKTFRYWGQKK
nr:13389_t:CDS:2 [Entrophospora candida]